MFDRLTGVDYKSKFISGKVSDQLIQTRMKVMQMTTKQRLTSWLIAALLVPLSGLATNCLWKAESDHGTFYLQGSVHLLKASDYPLDPAIEEAYAKSDTLVFETDIDQMLTTDTQKLLLQKALLPNGRTLQSELSPEIYSLLAEKLADCGLPSAAIQQFKPWFATMTLMVMRMQAMGMDPTRGLDQYFHQKALADQKAEVGLESVEFQIDLFDALSEGNQNGYTQHALKEVEQMETMLDDMLKAWKDGNLEKLNTIMMDSFKDYPDMYKTFVTDRNKAWAEKLDGMARRDKTCMVVVGTAHLAGEEGLLELLKAKGYTVKQL